MHKNIGGRAGPGRKRDRNTMPRRPTGGPRELIQQHLGLAREASQAGEYVRMEGHYQYAEHYYRTLNANGGGSSGARET